MTQEAREWLPPAALTGEPALEAANEVIRAWSRRWFSNAAVTAAHLEVRARARAGTGDEWRDFGEAAVRAEPRSALRLARLAMGLQSEPPSLNDNERCVALALADQVVGDLAAMFLEAAGAGSREARGGLSEEVISLAIVEGRDRLVDVALAASAAVRLRKSRLGLPSKPREAFGSLADEIAPARIEATVELGQAALTLRELRDLAVGDIIVLERSIAGGATVVARQSQLDIARGRVSRIGESLTLSLQDR